MSLRSTRPHQQPADAPAGAPVAAAIVKAAAADASPSASADETPPSGCTSGHTGSPSFLFPTLAVAPGHAPPDSAEVSRFISLESSRVKTIVLDFGVSKNIKGAGKTGRLIFGRNFANTGPIPVKDWPHCNQNLQYHSIPANNGGDP